MFLSQALKEEHHTVDEGPPAHSGSLRSGFASYTDAEVERWLYLGLLSGMLGPRLSQPLVPVLLAPFPVVPVLAGVLIADFFWRFVRYSFVSPTLAKVGALCTTFLKWPCALGSAIYLFAQQRYVLAVVAALWPLVAGFVNFPVAIVTARLGFPSQESGASNVLWPRESATSLGPRQSGLVCRAALYSSPKGSSSGSLVHLSEKASRIASPTGLPVPMTNRSSSTHSSRVNSSSRSSSGSSVASPERGDPLRIEHVIVGHRRAAIEGEHPLRQILVEVVVPPHSLPAASSLGWGFQGRHLSPVQQPDPGEATPTDDRPPHFQA